ncbi:MAG TPA: DEAD/DEAH box helicase [Deltaproteobacteria bacterium]|nr:DEAD/DEAH box helicase [Deltaproteobacteria bacterium]
MNRHSHDILSIFHPLVAKWFHDRIGKPTDIQALAWPHISRGDHVLITAPTGSGKTLTAFLWALNQLITGHSSAGHTRVLYVSPLKALNNDIRRNLLDPLFQLQQVFESHEEPFPNIRVLTRSGDTPQSDRRKMQRRPPEILITTPESLNILLSSKGGRSILMGLSTVILDEIHAVIGNKRGTYLITAVDRLISLSGEFQRIALSATVRPMETVASFVGGYRLEGTVHAPDYTPRQVHQVQSKSSKRYDIQVKFPEAAMNRPLDTKIWEPLADTFREIIHKNRSTLLFANSRRLCEKLTYLINKEEPEPIAYAHHGSLSRELRETVENKLKAGELKAIVATNSLELGIDIGALDEVILVQSPPAVSAGIQRVGRAGHQVGEVSRGKLFPTHSQDLLEAAVMASGIIDQNIEPLQSVEAPLDVLSQIIVSMTGIETWDLDHLYAQVKTSHPFRRLTRKQFDLVLNMLAGRYADSRIRELKPRISIDRLDNTVEARKGALLALYFSGGVIPDRGYFNLRHQDSGSKIGELDEEFVWEAAIGEIFTLGTQNWRIQKITHNDVFVLPVRPTATAPPFWKAEENGRDFHFSERIGEFLEQSEYRLDAPDFPDYIQQSHFMDVTAAKQLIDFLREQKKTSRSELPHRHHVLLEYIRSGPGGAPGNQVVIHTFWGGKVNRPYAMALEAAWKEKFHRQIEIYTSNDCVVLCLPHAIDASELLSMVTSTNFETLLRNRIEGSGFFSARFRECAGRALLLSRRRINERMPLWLSRLRSQKLMDAVFQYDDFPILLETWRSCLKDEFDLISLRQLLTELESGMIRWSQTETDTPSPMARTISWRQINQYMYMDDAKPSDKKSGLRSDLLREVVFTPNFRPAIPRALVTEFKFKRQRLVPGYSPDSARDLLDWVKERILIPLSEWEQLIKAMERDHQIDADDLYHRIGQKIVRCFPQKAKESVILSREMITPIVSSLYRDQNKLKVELLHSNASARDSDTDISSIPVDELDETASRLIGEWLRFFGPVPPAHLLDSLGLNEALINWILKDLMESETIISGFLSEGSMQEEICDSENFEILIRMLRTRSIPAFEPLMVDQLPLFLSNFQGIVFPKDNIEGLYRAVEQLLCYPAPGGSWESEIFPARICPYDPSWMDTLMQEEAIQWMGTGHKQISFCFTQDLDLMPATDGGNSENYEQLFSDRNSRYTFSTLHRESELSMTALWDLLWRGVWQGKISNDTFIAIRRGIENRFKIPEASAGTTSKGRRPGRFSKWRNRSSPLPGNWFRILSPGLPNDLVEEEERKKDRVRLLLDRYGILFRVLLEKELPCYRWPDLFRSLRLMEFSGEIMAGYFFDGISGPQFITHGAFQILQHGFSEESIYWLNATDPVSLCGMQIDSLKGKLPKRLAGTHLVYRGSRLVLISQRMGKTLTIHTSPEDPELHEYFVVLRHLLNRKFQPKKRITIESINDDPASESQYLDALRIQFDVLVDFKTVTLYRKRGESI